MTNGLYLHLDERGAQVNCAPTNRGTLNLGRAPIDRANSLMRRTNSLLPQIFSLFRFLEAVSKHEKMLDGQGEV
jgi:hypothetical protein